jgi:hypothetical protein
MNLVVPWSWLQGGAVAVLAAVAMMVYTGRLVPRATLNRIERICSDWHGAYVAEVERGRIRDEQISKILAAIPREVSR